MIEAPPAVVETESAPIIAYSAGLGAIRNLHLLAGRRYAEWNRYLHAIGGSNPFGEPTYRLTWGWERPKLYDDAAAELFHLERWMPMELFCDEREWDLREMSYRLQIGDMYHPEPYPRMGEYFEIQPCQWGLCDKCNEPLCECPKRHRVAHFRWPDKAWLDGAVVRDRIRLERTRQEIADQVAANEAAEAQEKKERLEEIQDQHGVREMVDAEAHMLIRNPTLRQDPSLMLSPAVAHKKTRHLIKNTI